jgi:hypothetical protein
MTDTITTDDMLKCAQRELALRKNAYPRWIAAGKMSEGGAKHQIDAMAAIVAHFQAAVEKERLI